MPSCIPACVTARTCQPEVSAASELPEKSYSAEAARHSFLASLPALVGLPAELWRHRYLVQNFFRRELLGRFRGSLLGLLWVLVHPIFLFVIYYLVFGYLFGPKFDPETGPDPHYALYLFSGVLVFTSLNEGLTRSCTAVVDNGNLVKKVAFPSQLLPVHLILIGLMVYLVGASVCVAAGTAYGVLQPGWSLLLLPVVLVVQFLFTYGFGLLLANLHVFSRDTSHLWGILSTAWMFLSPVFWYPAMFADKFGSADGVPSVLGTLLALNPAYPLLQAHRIALGAVDFNVADGSPHGLGVAFGHIGQHLGLALGWAVVFLLVGYGTFMSRRHKYADLV